jgi:putative methyltransferase (TIGR04325 family)
MIRALFRQIAPPVVVTLFRGNKTKADPTYLTFDDALKNCATENSYEDDDLIKAILAKTKLLKQQLANEPYPHINATTAFGLIALQHSAVNGHLTVIDFGGACGAHYFTFKKLLGEGYKINWNVVETPAMCKYAQELANAELHFFDSLPSALSQTKNINLVFSSGTIQYVREPKITLQQLVSIRTRYFFLTRLSLTVGEKDIISIQQSTLSANGSGDLPKELKDKNIEYPHSNIKEIDFNSILLKHYLIKLKFDEKTGIHEINDEPIIGYGLLLERKD